MLHQKYVVLKENMLQLLHPKIIQSCMYLLKYSSDWYLNLIKKERRSECLSGSLSTLFWRSLGALSSLSSCPLAALSGFSQCPLGALSGFSRGFLGALSMPSGRSLLALSRGSLGAHSGLPRGSLVILLLPFRCSLLTLSQISPGPLSTLASLVNGCHNKIWNYFRV